MDNDYIAACISGRAVRLSELRAVFNLVADKNNWKNPIDSTVVLGGDLTKALVHEAIVFFTGSVPTFRKISDASAAYKSWYRVTAPGYYSAVGS
jgi:hypothetical protein